MQPSTAPMTADEIQTRLDEMLDAVLSSGRNTARPAEQLAVCSSAQQTFVLHWLDVIVRTNSELGFQFVVNVPRAFAVMDLDHVEKWVINAMDVYDQQGLYPGSQALAAVDAFVEIQGQNECAARLDDTTTSILNHYLCGLSARPLRVKTGETAYTDTETVYLPAFINQFEDPEENAILYRLTATQLWAQIHFGTFRRESAKAPTLSQILDHYEDPKRARELFQLLEQVRLEGCVRRAFPGLARQMDRLNKASSAAIEKTHTLAAPLLKPNATVQDTLALLEGLYEDNPGLPPSPPWAGEIDITRAEKISAARVERETQQLAQAISALLASAADAAEPADEITLQKVAQPDEKAGEAESFVISVGGQTLETPEALNELLSSMQLDFEELSIPGPNASSGSQTYDPQAQPETPDPAENNQQAPDESVFLYDEWDFRRRHYRKDWCILRERDMPAGEAAFYSQTIEKYRGSVYTLRRGFEALRARVQRVRHQQIGDEIDLDALVRARIDSLNGEEMSERILSRLERRERDIAVVFMVDVSGSTKGWINDAERECLVLLCEALQILGDRYAIYGFSGMTRKRCELYRIKHIDEPYSDEVRSRIAGIEPRDYTRMGVTIRHLTQVLNNVSARTRLLITLSDGKPDDYDGYRGEYGIEDTRQALAEAKHAGIHPFCITIDQQAREYLPHMYGAVNYTLIDDVRQLPIRVSSVYRQLTV
ncbi:MAG: nitric oxide reductase activation protein NorD [Arenicellales bacterium]